MAYRPPPTQFTVPNFQQPPTPQVGLYQPQDVQRSGPAPVPKPVPEHTNHYNNGQNNYRGNYHGQNNYRGNGNRTQYQNGDRKTHQQHNYLKNNRVNGYFTHHSNVINPHNIEQSETIITGSKIPTVNDIYKIIGIVFGNDHPFYPNEKYLNRYINAFTHASYVAEYKNNTKAGNAQEYDLGQKLIPSGTYQRLEFFGDTSLQFCITEYIYAIFKDKGEGFLTKLRSKLVKSEACVTYAQYLGLAEWIFLSQDVEIEQNGRENPKILEDVFEAFVGALALEFGIDMIRNFILKIILHFYPNPAQDLAKLMDAKNDDNFKDVLLRECQANQWPQPMYFDVYEKKLSDGKTREFCVMTFLPENPNMEEWEYPIVKKDDSEYLKKITRRCKNIGVVPCKGYGPTKKKAQQEASREALTYLSNQKKKYGLVMQKVKIIIVDEDS